MCSIADSLHSWWPSHWVRRNQVSRWPSTTMNMYEADFNGSTVRLESNLPLITKSNSIARQTTNSILMPWPVWQTDWLTGRRADGRTARCSQSTITVLDICSDVRRYSFYRISIGFDCNRGDQAQFSFGSNNTISWIKRNQDRQLTYSQFYKYEYSLRIVQCMQSNHIIMKPGT